MKKTRFDVFPHLGIDSDGPGFVTWIGKMPARAMSEGSMVAWISVSLTRRAGIG